MNKLGLTNSEWFLSGAFLMLFLYFITYYFTKRNEKYNLFFALGCLVSIIRTVSYRLIYQLSEESVIYDINVKIDHLSFIWLPVLFVLLIDSLFPRSSNKKILKIYLWLTYLISFLIAFVPSSIIPVYFIYDYYILGGLVYSAVIIVIAVSKKTEYSIPILVVSFFLVIAVIHDVLRGSNVINTPFGELYAYFYLLFLYIASVILAQKHLLVDKKRLESQINFLHAQIQPHFLYNTLNTITAYCRTDPEKSRRLLIELSTYLRGKFKSEKDMFTSLKDEIELIKSYLVIEQVRFEERLEVEYDIDEDCNVLIPCLILQPIVENAVKHGLIPKKEGGKIYISVKNIENNIVVKIKDNGVGIEKNRLPGILDGNMGGIGLSNTNDRLKQHYNTEIIAKSELGVGTEFTITIPIKRGKK